MTLSKKRQSEIKKYRDDGYSAAETAKLMNIHINTIGNYFRKQRSISEEKPEIKPSPVPSETKRRFPPIIAKPEGDFRDDRYTPIEEPQPPWAKQLMSKVTDLESQLNNQVPQMPVQPIENQQNTQIPQMPFTPFENPNPNPNQYEIQNQLTDDLVWLNGFLSNFQLPQNLIKIMLRKYQLKNGFLPTVEELTTDISNATRNYKYTSFVADAYKTELNQRYYNYNTQQQQMMPGQPYQQPYQQQMQPVAPAPQASDLGRVKEVIDILNMVNNLKQQPDVVTNESIVTIFDRLLKDQKIAYYEGGGANVGRRSEHDVKYEENKDNFNLAKLKMSADDRKWDKIGSVVEQGISAAGNIITRTLADVTGEQKEIQGQYDGRSTYDLKCPACAGIITAPINAKQVICPSCAGEFEVLPQQPGEPIPQQPAGAGFTVEQPPSKPIIEQPMPVELPVEQVEKQPETFPETVPSVETRTPPERKSATAKELGGSKPSKKKKSTKIRERS